MYKGSLSFIIDLGFLILFSLFAVEYVCVELEVSLSCSVLDFGIEGYQLLIKEVGRIKIRFRDLGFVLDRLLWWGIKSVAAVLVIKL